MIEPVIERIAVELNRLRDGVDIINESVERERAYYTNAMQRMDPLMATGATEREQRNLISAMARNYQTENRERRRGQAITREATQKLMRLLEQDSFPPDQERTE